MMELINVKKNEMELSEQLQKATTKINDYHKIAKNAIFGISLVLAEIASKPKEYLEGSTFSSISEYAESVFGYKKAYTYKLVKIARFCDIMDEQGEIIPVSKLINNEVEGNYNFNILMDGDYFEYSPSQLLELIPLTDEQIKHNIEKLDSSLSCKELRQVVKNILKPAVETTATEETATEETATESNGEVTEKPLTDKEKIMKMLEICATLEDESIKQKIISVFEKSIKALEK